MSANEMSTKFFDTFDHRLTRRVKNKEQRKGRKRENKKREQKELVKIDTMNPATAVWSVAPVYRV